MHDWQQFASCDERLSTQPAGDGGRRSLRILTLALALAVIAPVVSAHSLHELETALGNREKYFQPIDKNTPDFTLQDADGRALSLVDFRGKVVVLHFIYTSCPDVCPLHAEQIAEIQAIGQPNADEGAGRVH